MSDIVDLFREVVGKVSEDLEILYSDGKGGTKVIKSPKMNFIFGNSQYIKERLDVYSKSKSQSPDKFPLIALFCPIVENRDDPDYFSKSRVSLVIACSSTKDWTNEQRQVTSFRNILRPIYERLLDVLLEDNTFDWGYSEKVNHSYSENYSYGRYGAYTGSGEQLSEPIDAIDIRSMEITIKNSNCRRK